MWEVLFWVLLILLVVPLPFKLIGYLKGSDNSKTIVKVEESLNALFFSFGLIALYGFNNQIQFFNAAIWQVWVIIAIAWSVISVIWSPKIAYANEVMGRNKTRVLVAISTLLYAPLVFAVYLYAY